MLQVLACFLKGIGIPLPFKNVWPTERILLRFHTVHRGNISWIWTWRQLQNNSINWLNWTGSASKSLELMPGKWQVIIMTTFIDAPLDHSYPIIYSTAWRLLYIDVLQLRDLRFMVAEDPCFIFCQVSFPRCQCITLGKPYVYFSYFFMLFFSCQVYEKVD
jgi:hypothetical protein